MPVIFLYMEKKKKTRKVSSRSKSVKKEDISSESSEQLNSKISELPSSSTPSEKDSLILISKIDQWLHNKQMTNAENTRKRNLENLRDYATLEQVVTEFMDTFLLIGYNLEGQRVLIQKCSNSRDQDALVELVRNITIAPIKPPYDEENL